VRVLLLNPPGSRTYIRDYFCSKTTKSNYLFHPVDLVGLSGTLHARHELAVLDCMAEAFPRARARIAAFAPEAIVSLVGSVSWDEDQPSSPRRASVRVLAIGDVLQEASEQRLAEEPWLEAALHDFSGDAPAILAGQRRSSATRPPTYRRPDRAMRRGPRKGRSRAAAAPRAFGTRLPLLLRAPHAVRHRADDYGCPTRHVLRDRHATSRRGRSRTCSRSSTNARAAACARSSSWTRPSAPARRR
jgi:hypothetical protein